MAARKSAPIAVTHDLNTSFASNPTAARQTAQVVTGTTANISDITANWTLSTPSITTASASTKMDVYVWGTSDDAGYPGSNGTIEVINGTAGNITLSALGQINLKWLKSTPVLQSGAALVTRDEASIVNALGFIPRRWGLVFVNNFGVPLNTSGNEVEAVEHYYD